MKRLKNKRDESRFIAKAAHFIIMLFTGTAIDLEAQSDEDDELEAGLISGRTRGIETLSPPVGELTWPDEVRDAFQLDAPEENSEHDAENRRALQFIDTPNRPAHLSGMVEAVLDESESEALFAGGSLNLDLGGTLRKGIMNYDLTHSTQLLVGDRSGQLELQILEMIGYRLLFDLLVAQSNGVSLGVLLEGNFHLQSNITGDPERDSVRTTNRFAAGIACKSYSTFSTDFSLVVSHRDNESENELDLGMRFGAGIEGELFSMKLNYQPELLSHRNGELMPVEHQMELRAGFSY